MARWSIPDGSLAETQADLYTKLSWVQMAVSLTASVAAGAQFSVKRRTGDHKVDIANHPFEQLLARPNPLMSRFELLEATFAFHALTGNAYWWLNRASPTGEPREIWGIPSHKMLPVPDGRMYLRGYAFFPEGHVGGVSTTPPILLDPWEVVHFKRFHPLSSFVGLSPIEALSTVAGGDLAAQKWNANFFGKDNAKFPGFLAFADPIDEPTWSKIKADVLEQTGGVRRAMMLLRNVGKGGIEWVQAGMSQKDMEFLGMRDFTKEEIFGLFAPGLSSLLSVNATEANATQGKATFIEFSVWPKLQAAGEKVTSDILPSYGTRLLGEFDDIRIVDRALKLQEQAAFERVHTIDEVRSEYYQAAPLPDGRGAVLLADAPPTKDAPTVVVGELVDTGAPVSPAQLPEPATPDDQVAQATAAPAPAQKALPIRPPGEGLSDDEESLYSALRLVLERHGADIADRVMAGQAVDLAQLASALEAELVHALMVVALDRVQAALSGLGQDLEPDAIVTAASRWAAQHAGALVQGLTETTQTVVQTATARFLATPGMTRAQLVALLRPAFGERRAETIAITEVTRAAAAAQLQLQQQLAARGITMERVWRTSADEAVCSVCGPLNDRPEAEWTGMEPPAHPRCRCFVTLRSVR